MAEMSATEALALGKSDGFGGGSAFMWIFALLILMFGGGNFGWGGRGPEPAGADQVAQGFANQQMQQIALSSANNNYETAQLINAQTNAMLQQNNTNLINAIQGFNSLGLQIQGLQSKLDSCCCDIKTQMLQYRLADAEAKNVAQANEISNFQQSQYILGQMGRWVAWLGNGSQAAAST